ncbi:MAG: molybdopterin cofactor-binding domain-containing protein, partial [Bradymonadaceae bacterium]
MGSEKEHVDAPFHTRGESEYVDDVDPPSGMLHAAVFPSPVANGTIESLDAEAALERDGVHGVFTSDDIPGENDIGPIVSGEGMLADGDVSYIGEPVAFVVADSHELARDAVDDIEIEVDEEEPIVDPREAHDENQFIGTPRTFDLGDVDEAWDECDVVLEDSCEIAGQEHVYLETNRSRAVPAEGDRVILYSSTQSPYNVQRAVSRVLDVEEHMVEVDVKRLGGGFGGKEDQATQFAAMVAIAAKELDRPVQIVLHRLDDMIMTGKRHPYSADFKIGAKEDGTIVAYDVELYQNAGADADLSPAVLERSLFHATNSYFIPNARIYAACCRTNIQPNTAFRGFGGPQAMFVIEAAVAKLAEKLDMSREELQRRNLLEEGDVFPYGQKAEQCKAQVTWDDCVETFDFEEMREEADRYNEEHEASKRGLSIMPICFGISFTKTHLNQASSLLHVYTDGSVSVSTGGVEMGQGLSTNIAEIAAEELGIDRDRVKLESTNTTRIANMSPSAASATTDLNGNATILAAERILDRFRDMLVDEIDDVDDPEAIEFADEYVWVDGQKTDWTWEETVMEAYHQRISLSEHAFYATPDIWFEADKEEGEPFAYHCYGTAITQVTVDCIRGTYDIDAVKLVHDLGRPLNKLVDLGQVEGGLAQGLGWMTLEELAWDDDGQLLSGALSTYKAPDVYTMPDELDTKLREEENPVGPRGSKAVGEPPLMYGIGVYFAIRDAMRAYDARDYAFDAPATPEKVLMGLHG